MTILQYGAGLTADEVWKVYLSSIVWLFTFSCKIFKSFADKYDCVKHVCGNWSIYVLKKAKRIFNFHISHSFLMTYHLRHSFFRLFYCACLNFYASFALTHEHRPTLHCSSSLIAADYIFSYCASIVLYTDSRYALGRRFLKLWFDFQATQATPPSRNLLQAMTPTWPRATQPNMPL